MVERLDWESEMIKKDEVSLIQNSHQEKPAKIHSPIDLKNEDLGQVFTSNTVARLMVDLLVKELDSGVVLDPCIGKNVFFRTLEEKEQISGQKRFMKIGIEVDSRIAPAEWFEGRDDRELHLQNFFEYDSTVKSDAVIMNPPYVRQENIAISAINAKGMIRKTLEKDYSKYIDARQNLYVYFFMKCHQVLKENGKLVAICYDSWLYTRFGEVFKNFLAENFRVDKIIHFEERAFTNINVGATVLELVKRSVTPIQDGHHNLLYVKFRRPEDYEKARPRLETRSTSLKSLKLRDVGPFSFPNEVFIRLEDLCRGKIRRGTSPKANKFFVFERPEFHETVPIVKDVKRIPGFLVLGASLRYIVNASMDQPSNELRGYLDDVKSKVAKTNRYRALKREMSVDDDWFRIRFVEPGSFIINYYLRKNIKFIYNPQRYNVSDNFYTFDTIVNPLLAVSILNSVFTKLAILKNSRTQGSGLRKIQLYEFRNVPVFNPVILDTGSSSLLEELGNRLINFEKGEISETIREIDQILLKTYNRLIDDEVCLKDAYDFYEAEMGGAH
jgi:hypothetical protein